MDILSILVGIAIGAAAALGIYIPLRKSMLKGKKEEILEKATGRSFDPACYTNYLEKKYGV